MMPATQPGEVGRLLWVVGVAVGWQAAVDMCGAWQVDEIEGLEAKAAWSQ
jgi:hypothetical protein